MVLPDATSADLSEVTFDVLIKTWNGPVPSVVDRFPCFGFNSFVPQVGPGGAPLGKAKTC